jgi:hypothetical protein
VTDKQVVPDSHSGGSGILESLDSIPKIRHEPREFYENLHRASQQGAAACAACDPGRRANHPHTRVACAWRWLCSTPIQTRGVAGIPPEGIGREFELRLRADSSGNTLRQKLSGSGLSLTTI